MTHGRVIKLYIRGKGQKQLKSAELSNWTGLAFIGKRQHVAILDEIAESHVPGIYFLLNKSQEQLKQQLYIGEADDVSERLKNHKTNKDWWEEFIVFLSKDHNLNKAHVRYLERRLYDIATRNVTMLQLENSNIPTGSKLPDSDIDEMEGYLDNMQFVINQLQLFHLIEPSSKKLVVEDQVEQVQFSLAVGRNYTDENGMPLEARLEIVDDGYQLLTGSFCRRHPRESFYQHSYINLFNDLIDRGLLIDSGYDGVYVTKEDILFSSSSAAAAIVKAGTTNGPKSWKTEDGRTLDEVENGGVNA